MSEMTSIQKDKLMSDLKLVMADAEALLAAGPLNDYATSQ